MDDVEDFGGYYAVVLHDPQLRRGLIAEPDPSRPTWPKSLSGGRLRFALAGAVRDLAMRIEPSQPPASETGGGLAAGQVTAR